MKVYPHRSSTVTPLQNRALKLLPLVLIPLTHDAKILCVCSESTHFIIVCMAITARLTVTREHALMKAYCLSLCASLCFVIKAF